MRPHPNAKLDPTWLVAVLLAVLLPLLAVLQYVWLTQLSHLGQERLQSLLQTGADRFAEEFDDALRPAYRTFELLVNPRDPRGLEAQMGVAYARVIEKSELARELLGRLLWVAPGIDGGLSLEEFFPEESCLRAIDWPEELEPLRDFLAGFAMRPQPGPAEIPFRLLGGVPMVLVPHAAATPGAPGGHRRPAWVVLVLERNFLEGDYFPALLEKYFSGDHGLRVNVAVRSAAVPHEFLYRSPPTPAGEDFAVVDAAAEIFRFRDQLLMVVNQPPPGLREPPATKDHFETAAAGARPPFPSERWRLLVRHPAGSLETAMAAIHRRNLLISFGILLVLAGAAALLFVSARRARNLARLQMEFVSGISHELRTPLAVISSAGENLADAVVRDPERTRRYGEVIHREGRRLKNMVERVIQFSRVQAGRMGYDLHPLSVAGVIASAVESYRTALDERGFEVTLEISDDLPDILGDEQALTSAVENLISNAIKYSHAEKTLLITVGAEPGASGTTVCIRVADRGAGIAAADRQLIFEPFRRGRGAQAAQIKGSGLGLSLVKEIVEAHGGSVAVSSTPGAGSSFTLRLPAADLPPNAAGGDGQES